MYQPDVWSYNTSNISEKKKGKRDFLSGNLLSGTRAVGKSLAGLEGEVGLGRGQRCATRWYLTASRHTGRTIASLSWLVSLLRLNNSCQGVWLSQINFCFVERTLIMNAQVKAIISTLA